MKKTSFYTSPSEKGKWAIKCGGTLRVVSVHRTQTEAWKEARRLARGARTDAVLKDKNGKILTKNSYKDEAI